MKLGILIVLIVLSAWALSRSSSEPTHASELQVGWLKLGMNETQSAAATPIHRSEMAEVSFGSSMTLTLPSYSCSSWLDSFSRVSVVAGSPLVYRGDNLTAGATFEECCALLGLELENQEQFWTWRLGDTFVSVYHVKSRARVFFLYQKPEQFKEMMKVLEETDTFKYL